MKRLSMLIVLAGIISLVIFFTITKNDNEIHLAAVGDILLSRDVEKRMEEEGLDYPYRQIKEFISEKDIVFGNLENPIYEGNNPVGKDPDLIFKAKNANAVELREAGFTVLNLANNHTMDHQEVGLVSTMKALQENGIDYIGAGFSYDEARKPLVIDHKGVKIGFLGYSAFQPKDVNFIDKADICRVSSEIGSEIEKAKTKCDFLVVTVHWGNEFHFYPSENQRSLAYAIIDSGADIILGHHPHVLQGIERYNDRFIFYSLGNFVFDRQIQKGTDESIILDLVIKDKAINDIRLIPVKIIDCQPTLAAEDVARGIFERLQKYSEGLGVDYKFDSGNNELSIKLISR